MGAFIDRLKSSPHKPEITDRETVEKSYNHWRFRVFYSMYVGYALYYLTRKSFTFAMPSLMQDLGFDKGQVGFLGSVLAISYGVSKFASGILSDQSNPRYFMAFGLMATGLFNVLFGLSSSLCFFAIFWGLNGWFQGFGWPACARLLTHWYSQNERGRWWSIWNTSQHLAGALVPIGTAICVYYFGWRAAMIFPGVLVIAGGFFLINRLCDTPQSLGLPTIEKFRNDFHASEATGEERTLTTREIVFEHVLSNPFIWILGISYFFVYIIRQGVNDWTVPYLIEEKGYSQIGAASVVFWFEVGGFLGSIAAGWSSDRIFSGNRGPINALFCLMAIAAVYAFWSVSGYAPFLDAVLVFAIGFLIFGPQMLIGVAAAELSHKQAAGTATGFIGCLAYLGAAFAGWPLGKIAQDLGWEGFFITLTVCAVAATLLLIPLWNAKQSKQLVLVREKAGS